MPLAIVAIVAMFLAFLLIPAAGVRQTSAVAVHTDQTAEVILYIDPPRIMEGFPPPLPTRNPHR